MPLISIEDLTIGFRGPALLENVSCTIEPNQRIGLLGRNGAGKTTLLRILYGEVQPDGGEVAITPGTRIARLTQEVPRDMSGSVHEIVTTGIADRHTLDAADQWTVDHKVETILSRMNLDGQQAFETLSSGMKRRVLLAQALVDDPHILLLDEPTNHLDIDAIVWLEDFLSRWDGTLIFITHDRSFLRNLATRIWEIDRGHLFDWSCDYDTFLRRKEEAIAAEEKQHALFDKKLAQEEAWIRQGIKARRTRNEGRVRALKAMRVERQQRRGDVGTAKLQIQEALRSGALVAEAKHISFAHGGDPIVDDFSTTIMRGDKVGIIGPNGAGKTTLLRLLLGQLQPQSGSVRLGTNLQIAYFDQLRDQLDPDKTVQENVVEGSDRVQIGGVSKHIIGYLQDFLFSPERARTPVRFLSGGERNRVLLARLMTRPANVLVLDEPTNDLDSETLELLEEQLMGFAGTVLLVSHDRTFLNNVVTSTIVFEPEGIHEYVGGYDDWQRTRNARSSAAAPAAKQTASAKPASAGSSTAGAATAAAGNAPTADSAGNGKTTGRRLSFNEQRELDRLPQQIEQLEAEIAQRHEKMADPQFYKQPGDIIAAATESLRELDEQLAAAYARWEALEKIANPAG